VFQSSYLSALKLALQRCLTCAHGTVLHTCDLSPIVVQLFVEEPSVVKSETYPHMIKPGVELSTASYCTVLCSVIYLCVI
jgi:hypothetical protein